MNWITLEIQGRTVRVPALKHQGKLWFHWNGDTHVVDLTSGSRKAGQDRASANPGVIAAPMPGKITRVTVKSGDSVARGQALIVMEAMKMEYTLEADIDGKVKELPATVGAQVALGEILVRVAPL